MSRLDSFIRRVSAQRDGLNWAVPIVSSVGGAVLELGLGNGRTYDHLRQLFPDRDIYVFDRHVAAHPDCIPDDDHMIIGDIFETLPKALEIIGQTAAFIHSDIGSGDAGSNAHIAAFLGQTIPLLTTPGALVLSDQDMGLTGWERPTLPDTIPPGRYFTYRKPFDAPTLS